MGDLKRFQILICETAVAHSLNFPLVNTIGWKNLCFQNRMDGACFHWRISTKLIRQKTRLMETRPFQKHSQTSWKFLRLMRSCCQLQWKQWSRLQNSEVSNGNRDLCKSAGAHWKYPCRNVEHQLPCFLEWLSATRRSFGHLATVFNRHIWDIAWVLRKSVMETRLLLRPIYLTLESNRDIFKWNHLYHIINHIYTVCVSIRQELSPVTLMLQMEKLARPHAKLFGQTGLNRLFTACDCATVTQTVLFPALL